MFRKINLSYLLIIGIGFLICLNSCSSTGFTKYSNISPDKLKPSDGKWLVDYPLLVNIDNSFSDKTLYYYKKIVGKKFKDLTIAHELNGFSTLNSVIRKNPKSLVFYKEQSGCDYLIETEIKLIRKDSGLFQINPDENISNELFIVISIYDLHSNNMLMDREYTVVNSYEGTQDIAFYPKMNKFIDKAIRMVITDFAKTKSW